MDSTDRYAICLYYTTYTLVSLGYGDVTPATTAERYFCVMTMLIGAYFFGYVFGSITSLIASANAASEEFYQTLEQLNEFTQARNVTKGIHHALPFPVAMYHLDVGVCMPPASMQQHCHSIRCRCHRLARSYSIELCS